MTEPAATALPVRPTGTTFWHEYVDCRHGQLHLTQLRADRGRAEGRPLVLMSTRSRSLRGLLPELDFKREVVIADIPGTGGSSPVHEGAQMEDVAASLVDLLDARGWDSADFFGFHTGSKVVTALAARWPDRVTKLVVAGKTHSLVVDKDARVSAMQTYLAKKWPDVAIVGLEGRFLDDGGAADVGRSRMFATNFVFGFTEALETVEAETLVLEVTSPAEDELYGRQGRLLAERMPHAKVVEIPQIDPTGLTMYVGHAQMADELRRFFG